MLTLLQPSVRQLETVSVQRPDGLEFLRMLPIVRTFVPDNHQPVVVLPGRVLWTDLMIRSSEPLTLGVKFDHTFSDVTYHGIMPVCQPDDSLYEYECKVDFTERISH